MTTNFNVEFLEEAIMFLDKTDEKARTKIIYNIHKSKVVRDDDLFKKLNGDIWEFRTLYNKTYYRLFAFWDKTNETLVVATHGLIKKTAKTPSFEIEKAERIMRSYFENKQINK
jgi:phage-related protein